MESFIFSALIVLIVFCLCVNFDETANRIALLFIVLALFYGITHYNKIEQQFIEVGEHKFKSAISQGFK